jgi:tetratricopeptide (TPR) repeat protein
VRPTGDGENLIKHSKNCIKYCEEGEVPIFLPWAWSLLGMGHYYLGEFETALKHVQKGLKMQKDMGISMNMSLQNYNMGMIHLGLGELKSAQSCAEKALDLSQENHEKYVEGISWTLLGRVIGKKKHPQIDRAEEHILKGIKILDELKVKPLVSVGYFYLGELYTDTGKQDKALNYLKKADEMYQEMDMDYYLTKTQEVLGQAGGGR